MGRFVEIRDMPPAHRYAKASPDNDPEAGDRDTEWMRFVKWTGVGFSTNGDSGSLIFAVEKRILVP
jgi:hypothetical protein